jgi:hypothetical protein
VDDCQSTYLRNLGKFNIIKKYYKKINNNNNNNDKSNPSYRIAIRLLPLAINHGMEYS